MQQTIKTMSGFTKPVKKQKYVPNSVAFRKWVSHALSEFFRMGKPEEPPVILVNYVPGRFGGTDELKGTFVQDA